MFGREGGPLGLVRRAVHWVWREGGPLCFVGRAVHWIW